MHFAHDYIGQAWIAGENDCYSFVKKIWRNHYQINGLPQEPDGTNPKEARRAFMAIKKQYFTPIDKPVDGCAVVMKQGKYPAHVGIWIEELKGILHCVEQVGVVFTYPANLYTLGYDIYSYYEVK